MSKLDYIQRNDDTFAAQLVTFKTNIGSYATLLGLSPAQIATQAADCDYYGYSMASHKLMQAAASQWAGWKDLMRGGGTPPPTGAPVAPVLPTAVAAVAPGIETRHRALARTIKAHAAYNPTLGRALGIEGAEAAPVDLAGLQPEIAATIQGGQVLVRWGWQGHADVLDQIEIQVDRGDGYRVLTYDTTPNYYDTATPPTAPTRWKYKAIYRVGDQRVGQWSLEAGVTVGG